MQTMTYEMLHSAVTGGAAALRAITVLDPAGGAGDKVFPPTYLVDNRADTKYAVEQRRVGGETVTAVLLDSVASQANRMEDALQAAVDRGELSLPLISVDFSKTEGLADIERISALQAPHRAADALLRDSVDSSGTLFRYTAIGKELTDARPNHATAMFKYCPHALVFGVWDSTGPKGGLGAKFQRAMVSEIVAIGAQTGRKTASRLDPAGIMKNAAEVYEAKDEKEGWTLDKDAAKQDKGKPIKKGEGRPSDVNHSNIPPSIDVSAGGITFDHAVQTAVLSMPALRRLRFTNRTDGSSFPTPAERGAGEDAARTLLAALGIAALVLAREDGYDLRSRALLIPRGPLEVQVVGRDGGAPTTVSVSKQDALDLVTRASEEAAKVGMAWPTESLRLVPSAKLATLIRKSRDLAVSGAVEE